MPLGLRDIKNAGASVPLAEKFDHKTSPKLVSKQESTESLL
jgi:hypothetical protein